MAARLIDKIEKGRVDRCHGLCRETRTLSPPSRQTEMERFSRGQSVPPSALRRDAKAPAAPLFRANRVENSRFLALFGRRDAESSDALLYLAPDFARACRWRDIA